MYIPPSCNGNRGGVVLLASPPTSVVDVINSGKMYMQFGRFIPPLYKKNSKKLLVGPSGRHRVFDSNRLDITIILSKFVVSNK